METKLARIADKSRNEKQPIFTSLYHLINEDLLKECHKELDGSKAVGIDNVSKKEYAEKAGWGAFFQGPDHLRPSYCYGGCRRRGLFCKEDPG